MPEIDWNVENTRVLCQLFAEQVARGNRPNTHLNSVGFAEVEKGLRDRLGILATKAQIKNKWDKLKKDFKAWKKLLLRQTETGWCPIKGTIIMNEEWWKKARADIPECGKFKKIGLQNSDELKKCFADIINIGVDHLSPHMANPSNTGGTKPNVTEPEQCDRDTPEDEVGGNYVDTSQFEQESPFNPNGKRPPTRVDDKGKKPKTGTAALIQEAVSSIVISANSYTSSKQEKYSILEVIEHVVACGAEVDSNEHFIAIELFVKKEQREMFMTLPSESRKNWLTRKYNAKYGN